MKTFALALLALATVGGLFAQPQLNYLSLSEGLTLTHDPGPPENPNPQSYRVDWWTHSGRVYYLEGTDDLENGTWSNLLNYFPGYFVGDFQSTLQMSFTAPRYFIRLRYVEGRRVEYLFESYFADTDHDGVGDYFEMSGIPPTHPLESRDVDTDDLPDDWERRIFWSQPPPENTDTDPNNDVTPLHLGPTDIVDANVTPNLTAYQRFKQDWVKGLCIEYGGEFFSYFRTLGDALPTLLFTGDQDGWIRLTYADADLNTVASLEVFPRASFLLFLGNDPVAIQAQPRALYTYVTNADPTLCGYSFSATPGYELIQDPETGAHLLGPPDGRPAPRDLLRSIDTMLWPSNAVRPTGATHPLPFRRAQVSTPAGPVARRLPASLAITSLPVTVIGRDRFPVVLRDCPSHSQVIVACRYFPDFNEQFITAPGRRIVEQVAESEDLINPVVRSLDADGLPQALAAPDIYPSATLSMFRSPLTFARWYRDKSAQGYVMQGISGPFTPPDQEIVYSSGLYSGADGFYPHRDDVNEMGKFTTELHCRMNYTPDTKLYLGSNDDCWVYVNGKLVNDLDLGGIPPTESNTSTYQREVTFSNIRSQLELAEETGACRLDVFHADRFSQISDVSRPRSQLRVLSTTGLLPIYFYQVVAECSTSQPLTYSLSAPTLAGMTISSTTGKILWDLYATPAVAPGTYPVTVQVTDPLGNSDTQTFNLTVLD